VDSSSGSGLGGWNRESSGGPARGIVFNLQRFSLHDGPGIRTTVFLKGCPLRCLWCNNPESQEASPQLVFRQELCIGCGACVAACPRGAIEVLPAEPTAREPQAPGEDAPARPDPGVPRARRVLADRCDLCGRCLDACLSGALEQTGREMTADAVVAEVEEDRLFYDRSGGGLTLSGGEPLAQPDFSLAVLRGCREAGIRTAVESSGHAPWGAWAGLLPYLDLVLLDLKEIDPVRHRALTGASNSLILANARSLAAEGVPVIVRRPLIPGCNDSPESLHALGRFVRDLATVQEVDLLPYHRLGSGKYASLGRDHALRDRPPLSREEAEPARLLLLEYGIRVKIGG
jgi:pyruvate formate lyase activating enzyme